MGPVTDARVAARVQDAVSIFHTFTASKSHRGLLLFCCENEATKNKASIERSYGANDEHDSSHIGYSISAWVDTAKKRPGIRQSTSDGIIMRQRPTRTERTTGSLN